MNTVFKGVLTQCVSTTYESVEGKLGNQIFPSVVDLEKPVENKTFLYI